LFRLLMNGNGSCAFIQAFPINCVPSDGEPCVSVGEKHRIIGNQISYDVGTRLASGLNVFEHAFVIAKRPDKFRINPAQELAVFVGVSKHRATTSRIGAIGLSDGTVSPCPVRSIFKQITHFSSRI
jgi:hypothetical protein